MSKSDLNFKRKERKYLILEHNFEEIKEELTDHIPIHIFKGKNPYMIETTYLDTKDHLLFNEYLNQRKFRFKIRLRKYNNHVEKYLVELIPSVSRRISRVLFTTPLGRIRKYIPLYTDSHLCPG